MYIQTSIIGSKKLRAVEKQVGKSVFNTATIAQAKSLMAFSKRR